MRIDGSRLSSFSGSFRIDDFGELMVVCGEPLIAYTDVYEYQRRRVVPLGKEFGEYSVAALIPTDYHGPWADERMEKKWPGLHAVKPPRGWEWVDDEWTVTSSETTRDNNPRLSNDGAVRGAVCISIDTPRTHGRIRQSCAPAR